MVVTEHAGLKTIRTSVTHPILVRRKARAMYSQESVDHSHAQIQWSFKGLLKSVYFKTGMCLPKVTTGVSRQELMLS